MNGTSNTITIESIDQLHFGQLKILRDKIREPGTIVLKGQPGAYDRTYRVSWESSGELPLLERTDATFSQRWEEWWAPRLQKLGEWLSSYIILASQTDPAWAAQETTPSRDLYHTTDIFQTHAQQLTNRIKNLMASKDIVKIACETLPKLKTLVKNDSDYLVKQTSEDKIWASNALLSDQAKAILTSIEAIEKNVNTPNHVDEPSLTKSVNAIQNQYLKLSSCMAIRLAYTTNEQSIASMPLFKDALNTRLGVLYNHLLGDDQTAPSNPTAHTKDNTTTLITQLKTISPERKESTDKTLQEKIDAFYNEYYQAFGLMTLLSDPNASYDTIQTAIKNITAVLPNADLLEKQIRLGLRAAEEVDIFQTQAKSIITERRVGSTTAPDKDAISEKTRLENMARTLKTISTACLTPPKNTGDTLIQLTENHFNDLKSLYHIANGSVHKKIKDCIESTWPNDVLKSLPARRIMVMKNTLYHLSVKIDHLLAPSSTTGSLYTDYTPAECKRIDEKVDHFIRQINYWKTTQTNESKQKDTLGMQGDKVNLEKAYGKDIKKCISDWDNQTSNEMIQRHVNSLKKMASKNPSCMPEKDFLKADFHMAQISRLEQTEKNKPSEARTFSFSNLFSFSPKNKGTQLHTEQTYEDWLHNFVTDKKRNHAQQNGQNTLPESEQKRLNTLVALCKGKYEYTDDISVHVAAIERFEQKQKEEAHQHNVQKSANQDYVIPEQITYAAIDENILYMENPNILDQQFIQQDTNNLLGSLKAVTQQ